MCGKRGAEWSVSWEMHGAMVLGRLRRHPWGLFRSASIPSGTRPRRAAATPAGHGRPAERRRGCGALDIRASFDAPAATSSGG